MARVSYVPFDQTYADLFAFCNITLETSDFGGNQGWYADDFNAAASQAFDYLNDHYDELYDLLGEDKLENYYNMLDNYSVFYWSTEKPIYG